MVDVLRRRVRSVRRTARSVQYLPLAAAIGPAVGYLGWGGQGNAGDDAMFHAHRDALDGIRVLRLPVNDIGRAVRLIRVVAGRVRVRMVVLGGGTVFGRADWRVRIEELQRLLPAVPWVAAGVGIEDPAFRSNRSFTSEDELQR